MSRLTHLFSGRTVSSVMERARRKFASGKLGEAMEIVERGLLRFPGSATLVELQLSIRRARAHKSMRRLEVRIEESKDALAYEELIRLYQELALPDEAWRKAEQYLEAHSDHDSPHLILGEMLLEAFFEDLQARHGRAAHDHLIRAASINLMSLQPRLLLAELYFCIDARCSLAALFESLKQMAPATGALERAFEVMEHVSDATAEERVDALFEHIEAAGELEREPTDWPLSKRRNGQGACLEGDVDPVIEALVEAGTVDEVVLLRRDGSLMTHASPLGTRGEDDGEALVHAEDGAGFVHVVHTVARKVFPQAAELDMGKFRRCTIRGAFGNVVVGRVGDVMVGARCASSNDPLRMWEKLSAQLEGAMEGESR